MTSYFPSIPVTDIQFDLNGSFNRSLEPSLQRILEKGPGVLYQLLYKSDGSITLPFISPNCCLVFEREASVIQADVQQWLSEVHKSDQPSFQASLTHSIKTRQFWRWEGRWVLPSGRIQRIQILAQPEWQPTQEILWDGIMLLQPDLLPEVYRDEFPPHKSNSADLAQLLQTSEQQARLLQTVIDSTQDWIFVKDHHFRYILVNQSYAAAIGSTVDVMIGKDDIELNFSNELVFGNPGIGIRGFRADDQAVLAGQRIHNPYDPATTADGTLLIFDTQKIPLHADGKIFAVLGFCHDVTARIAAEDKLKQQTVQLSQKNVELQKTQTQLIQSEKMSSLGQLVAGIAHEINNPVNFIYGNLIPASEYVEDLMHLLQSYQQHNPNPSPELATELAAVDFDFLSEDLSKLLTSMKVGAERIRDIVRSLRNFSRLDESAVKWVDLHEGIESTLMILQHRFKASLDFPEIQLIKDYGMLPLVECYPGQLNQVLMNLLSNALDALVASSLWKEAQLLVNNNPQTAPAIRIHTAVVEGESIVIQIIDNGPGIPGEIQNRIFDPFFTTKPIGRGTGLGLSISYQIVTEKHQGSLQCYSELGIGTTFTMKIPIQQNLTPS